MMFYYVDQDGNYLGGWDAKQNIPGAIRVDTAPSHATQKWDGVAWGVPIINVDKITKLQAVRFFQENSAWDQLKALISQDIYLKDRWDAASILAIDDPDVLSLAIHAKTMTGKSLQTMFNEASKL